MEQNKSYLAFLKELWIPGGKRWKNVEAKGKYEVRGLVGLHKVSKQAVSKYSTVFFLLFRLLTMHRSCAVLLLRERASLKLCQHMVNFIPYPLSPHPSLSSWLQIDNLVYLVSKLRSSTFSYCSHVAFITVSYAAFHICASILCSLQDFKKEASDGEGKSGVKQNFSA